MNFIQDQEEHKGGEIRCASQCIFCVCESNLLLTQPFFHFGISNCFVIAKEEFQKKLLQQNQINHPNANLEYLVDSRSLFLRFFRILDTWLTPRTHDRHVTDKVLQKIWPASNSVSRISRHVPILRTCLGHFQLSWMRWGQHKHQDHRQEECHPWYEKYIQEYDENWVSFERDSGVK